MKLRRKYKKEYEAWKVMRADYKTPCCKQWQSFAQFLCDMGLFGAKCTVDRINKEEGYTPENCKWIPFIHKI